MHIIVLDSLCLGYFIIISNLKCGNYRDRQLCAYIRFRSSCIYSRTILKFTFIPWSDLRNCRLGRRNRTNDSVHLNSPLLKQRRTTFICYVILLNEKDLLRIFIGHLYNSCTHCLFECTTHSLTSLFTLRFLFLERGWSSFVRQPTILQNEPECPSKYFSKDTLSDKQHYSHLKLECGNSKSCIWDRDHDSSFHGTDYCWKLAPNISLLALHMQSIAVPTLNAI